MRWSCSACDRTVVGRPGHLPDDWFECPAPPWRAWQESSFACPDHAADVRARHQAQWASIRGRELTVSADDYERVKGELAHALTLLDRLKVSAQGANDR